MDGKAYADMIIADIRSGKIDNFAPLIALFKMAGKHLTLDERIQLSPFFKLRTPKQTTIMCGRQVAKSWSVAQRSILMTGMMAGMNTLIVEPRFEQKKRFHAQILNPLLKGCVIRDELIDKRGNDSMDMKTFRNGNFLMLVNSYTSPDSVRGASGISSLLLDECSDYLTEIIAKRAGKILILKIFEIKSGDVLVSFKDGAILYSTVVRDASYKGVRPCYRVTTASGRSISCTEGHLLPTNNGKMRLSEIVEYMYGTGETKLQKDRTVQSRGTREHRHAATECDHGIAHGGRCIGGAQRSVYSEDSMESQLETARVRFSQIQAVTRARTLRTAKEGESRIRGLLVRATPDSKKNVSLVVCNDVSGSQRSETDYMGVSVLDHASDRAGLVVHGRRVQTDRTEFRCVDFDERLCAGGRRSAANLVEGGVGHRFDCDYSETFVNRKNSKDSQSDRTRISAVGRSDQTVCAREHEVQDRTCDTSVCCVRGTDHTRTASVLLSAMCRDSAPNDASDVSGSDTRLSTREEPSVQSCAQGSHQCAFAGCVCCTAGREESGAESVQHGVETEERGETQREASSVETGAQGRSGVQAAEKAGVRPALSGCESRSGAVCTSERTCECCCAGTVEERSGESGKTEKVSCQNQCRSCTASAEAGARSVGRTAPVSEADTGRVGCKKGQRRCCQERTVSEVDGSAQSGSRAICRASEEISCVSECTECETSGNEELLTAVPATYQYDPIVSIEYIGERPVYDIEVVGTHNFILANGLCSYNCQDINNDFIPVLEECCSASDYGIMTYLGTAKTLDGTLAASFERSSQGHWCIRCHHCGKYNIAAPQMELFKMMRSTGLSCAYCSGTLATRTGFFVHAYPSRIEEHVGYHIPQIVFPFHCEREDKWRDVMRKRRELNKTVFLNEVLGVPDDTATRILTLKDLLDARNQLPNTLETAIQERENYDMIVVGVDWTGGGNGTSTTVIAVLGRRFYSGQTDVLYMKRLPQGTHPKIESDTVVQVAQQVRADLIAHDFTGAGWMREALLIGSHSEWATRVYPISYSYKPTANMVTYVDTGIRRSYSVDKTKSLLMTMMAIQYRKITLPMFDALDKSAPQRDFLAIVEQKQELAKGSDVYLLAKSPSFPDDGAHAVNIGFVAMCDVANQYPVFAIDTSKYDMDSVEYNLLTGE